MRTKPRQPPEEDHSMKLSFSTNAFVRYSVFEAVEKIAAAGYRGVELLADAPHLYPDSTTSRDLEKLGRILDRTGLRAVNINANTAAGYYGRPFWEPVFEPSLANPEAAERRWRIEYSKRCIDMARFLGVPNVSITSGRMVPGAEPAKGLELLRGALVELIEYAAQNGVRLGIEYEPGLLVERYEELRSLLDDLNSPFLGANLDLGHSHVLGEDPEIVIGGLAARIFHIHIEDIRDGKHYHLIPGRGDMDFSNIFRLLDACSYQGWVTVELYTYPDRPEDAAKESIHFLRNFSLGSGEP
jgi:protein FrlC